MPISQDIKNLIEENIISDEYKKRKEQAIEYAKKHPKIGKLIEFMKDHPKTAITIKILGVILGDIALTTAFLSTLYYIDKDLFNKIIEPDMKLYKFIEGKISSN